MFISNKKLALLLSAVFFQHILFAQQISSISSIQGTGKISPLMGQNRTIKGVVVGKVELRRNTIDYFVQDQGDGNALTSDGIIVSLKSFISNPNFRVFSIGDEVTLSGRVEEYSITSQYRNSSNGYLCDIEEEIDQCETVLSNTDVIAKTSGATLPDPVVLNIPDDIDAALIYKEMLEGMLVRYESTDDNKNYLTVVGPTNFSTNLVTSGDNPHLLNNDSILIKSQAGATVGVRNWAYQGRIPVNNNLENPENLIVGSKINNLTGVLRQDVEQHIIYTQENDEWQINTSKNEPTENTSLERAQAGVFKIGSFNARNFNTRARNYAKKLEKVKMTIVQLGCPNVMAFQEASTQAIQELIALLNSQSDCQYSPEIFSTHQDIGNKANIIMYALDSGNIDQIQTDTTWQSCHVDGSTSAADYDNFCDNISGQYPLFSRRPLIMKATVYPKYIFNNIEKIQAINIAIINVHLKSFGDSFSDRRRQAQADYIKTKIEQLAINTDKIILLGDLNSALDSQVVATILAHNQGDNALLSAWDFVAQQDHFTYNFQGASEILDHVFVSNKLEEIGGVNLDVLHLNSLYPYFRESSQTPYRNDETTALGTSDHDPIVLSVGGTPFNFAYISRCVYDFIDLFNDSMTQNFKRKISKNSQTISSDLHAFRDDYLNSSDVGRQWVQDYYLYSPEIAEIVVNNDPQLAIDLSKIVGLVYPAIGRIINQQAANQADVFTAQDYYLIMSVIKRLQNYASQDFRLFLINRLRNIPFESYIQQPIDDVVNGLLTTFSLYKNHAVDKKVSQFSTIQQVHQ